jgi:hypothetical protein
MNYSSTAESGKCVEPSPPSEIQRESIDLDKAIQQTFDSSQELLKRLQPVLSNYPRPNTESDKNPEESLCDFGSMLRRNRRVIEGINVTLNEILNTLAL